MDRRQSPSRAGFTLVEVLIAILIIALLIAILLPTIAGAIRTARQAQVTAELNNLATALASFKNTYGDYPPSRVLLCESGYSSLSAAFLNATVGSPPTVPPETPLASSSSTDLTNQQLMQRSLLYLRKFWPRCDFNSVPTQLQVTNHQFNDFDGDGVLNGNPIVLSGSECLAFFLGGLPIRDTSNAGLVTGTSGFSRLPQYPFVNAAIATNRTVPNYEFNNARLVDLDGDHIPSYLDPLDITPGNRRPYAYFSSYGSNSYDPNDDNGNGHLDVFEVEDDGTTIVERGFQVGFPVYDSTATQQTLAISPAPNPYTSGAPIQAGVGVLAWINPSSFQLFSAGADRFWGTGGQYVQNSLGSAGKLPISPNPPDLGNIHGDDVTGVRRRESDNLTNFSGGRLD